MHFQPTLLRQLQKQTFCVWSVGNDMQGSQPLYRLPPCLRQDAQSSNRISYIRTRKSASLLPYKTPSLARKLTAALIL